MNTGLSVVLVLFACIYTIRINAQSVYQSSANSPICVGTDTEFTYTGTCTPIQWRFEGSATIISSTNKKLVIRWNSATSIAAVAAQCSSTTIGSPTFVVYANVSPSVSISGNATICGGAATTYTATPVNGGSNPSYVWMINGVAQTYPNSRTFTTTQLALNNTVSVRMTSNQSCVSPAAATSSPITITQVTTPLPVSVSISGKAAICGSEIPTYTATAVNGGASPVYTWYRNGVEVTDNELNQSPQYQYKPHYGLPNGGAITCSVTSTLSCTSGNPASSNVINVSVTNESPSLTMNIDRTTFCQGDPVKFQAISNFPITSYAWSIDNSVTLSRAAEFSPSQISTGNVVYLAATLSTSCGIVSKYVNSQAYPITVYPSISASIDPSGQKTVCSDCSQLVTAIQNVNYTYQWRKDGIAIPSATESTYIANEAGAYDVLVSRTSCDMKPSNSLTLLKNNKPVANAGQDKIITLPVNSINLVGTGSDSDGTITNYAWSKIAGPSTSLSNINTSQVSAASLRSGTYIFRLTVTDNLGDTGFDDVQVIVNYPPNNYNWIKETSVLAAGKLSVQDMDAITFDERAISWQYFDGVGRPMQSVVQQGSPSNNDVTQPIVYDQFGREVVKYLPYVSNETNGDYKLKATSFQGAFYQNANDVDHDTPFSKVSFEPSPLNRVLKQGAPGTSWQPNADVYSMTDKTVKKRYELNSDNEVLRLSYDLTTGMISESELAAGKYYGVNQLYANKTYDEKNNEVIEYVDKEGRMVCKKVYVKTENNIRRYAETYYLYDDLGNLVVVIPPEGIEKLKTLLNLN